MIPAAAIAKFINPATNKNASVFSQLLPEPTEYIYSDVVDRGGPNRMIVQSFGGVETELSGLRDGRTGIGFSATIRVLAVHGLALIDRIE